MSLPIQGLEVNLVLLVLALCGQTWADLWFQGQSGINGKDRLDCIERPCLKANKQTKQKNQEKPKHQQKQRLGEMTQWFSREPEQNPLGQALDSSSKEPVTSSGLCGNMHTKINLKKKKIKTTFIYLLISLFVHARVCLRVCVCVGKKTTTCRKELILPFVHVCPRNQTQVVKLGNKYLLSHLAGPALTFEPCLLVNVLKEAV